MAPEGERWVDGEEARRRGLALVDLSDGFAPGIFQDGKSATGVPLPNRYRAVFVGLANDRSDGDGEPLRPGERNYLELYGIPPSLSVLRQRFIEDAERECGVDAAKLLAVDGIATWARPRKRRRSPPARVGAEAPGGAEPGRCRFLGGASGQGASLSQGCQRAAAGGQRAGRICRSGEASGFVRDCSIPLGISRAADGPMRNATMNFQQKNGIFAQADLTRSTLEAMTRPLLAERLPNLAAGAGRTGRTRRQRGGGRQRRSRYAARPRGQPRQVPTYRDRAGEVVPVPDLVGQATLSLMAGLGLSPRGRCLGIFSSSPRE